METEEILQDQIIQVEGSSLRGGQITIIISGFSGVLDMQTMIMVH